MNEDIKNNDGDSAVITEKHLVRETEVTPSVNQRETLIDKENVPFTRSDAGEDKYMRTLLDNLNKAAESGRMSPVQKRVLRSAVENSMNQIADDQMSERKRTDDKLEFERRIEAKYALKAKYPQMEQYKAHLAAKAEKLGVKADEAYLNSEVALLEAKAEIESSSLNRRKEYTKGPLPKATADNTGTGATTQASNFVDPIQVALNRGYLNARTRGGQSIGKSKDELAGYGGF